MKKTMTILAALLACLVCSISTRAQDRPELQAFQQAAGDLSILYYGKQAPRYNFLANGHQYWSQTAFEEGDLVFEGNFYHDIPINIDALAQRILVKQLGSPFAVALTPAQTPSFSIGGRNFVGIGPGEALPEGIYEVFGEGQEHVYKHVWKQLNHSVSNVNGQAIGYIDENYREDVTRYFAYFQSYYFRDANGHFTRIKRRNALIRQFPDREQEIRKALRAARLDRHEAQFDDFCKAVLTITAR